MLGKRKEKGNNADGGGEGEGRKEGMGRSRVKEKEKKREKGMEGGEVEEGWSRWGIRKDRVRVEKRKVRGKERVDVGVEIRMLKKREGSREK